MDDKCTARLKAIKDQSEFCRQLQDKLSDRIQNITGITWAGSGVLYYTQLQADIIRLRRELLELSKMVGEQH